MSDKKTKEVKKKKVKVPKPKKLSWEEQAIENLAGWKRAQADYANLQKEHIQDRADFVKYANGNLVVELLSVYDNFKSAFTTIPEKDKDNGWVIGFEYIKKQIGDFLEHNGVTEIKTIGEKFDPQLHEAVDSQEDKSETEDIILKEVKSGYKLNDKVIQCAKVVVSK